MDKWINIEIEEPPEHKHVLLFDEDEKICVGYKSSLSGYTHHPAGDFATGAPLFYVKYWSYLPDFPNC